jgi:hypothetical protein
MGLLVPLVMGRNTDKGRAGFKTGVYSWGDVVRGAVQAVRDHNWTHLGALGLIVPSLPRLTLPSLPRCPQAEMENVHFEKKQLVAQWKSSLLAIQKWVRAEGGGRVGRRQGIERPHGNQETVSEPSRANARTHLLTVILTT